MNHLLLTAPACLTLCVSFIALLTRLKAKQFRLFPVTVSAFVSGMALIWTVTAYSKLLTGAPTSESALAGQGYFGIILSAALLLVLGVSELLAWASGKPYSHPRL